MRMGLYKQGCKRRKINGMNKLHCSDSAPSRNIDMKLCNEEMCEIYDALPKKSLLVQYRKLE